MILALALSTLLAQTPPAPEPAWAGTITVGLIALTGNSQTLTFSSNAALERKTSEWIAGVKAFAAYGQSTTPTNGVNQVTALNAGIQARGDRRFSDQLSAYLLAGIDADHLKSIESRPFGEVGISLIWFDTRESELQKSLFKTDLGFRYGREYRFQYYPMQLSARQDPALDTVTVAAPRIGAFFRYAINKDVIFTEDASALQNLAGESRLIVVSTTKLAARLSPKVSLGLSYVVQEDTAPPKGKVQTDTTMNIGLEFSI
jgi:hypothetical protein